MQRIKLPQMDCERVCREIGDFVIDTIGRTGSTGCVIGLSGGVDSSTTAALIKRAFDRSARDREPRFRLVGYILPSRINDSDDIKDARTVADFLGIACEVLDLEPLVQAFKTTNPEAFERHYDRGNLISRIRANVLSTKAATEQKTLAGTGNKDEDFGIGYYTLFGDGAVHISPIGGLPKRLVREMADFLGLPDHIVHRTPTAGLEPGQSDFKDLGYDYDVVERVVEGYRQGLSPAQLAGHDQIRPLVRDQIDRYRSVCGEPRLSAVAAVVEDVLRRHGLAKFKLKIIHPPAPVITLDYPS